MGRNGCGAGRRRVAGAGARLWGSAPGCYVHALEGVPGPTHSPVPAVVAQAAQRRVAPMVHDVTVTVQDSDRAEYGAQVNSHSAENSTDAAWSGTTWQANS